MTWQVHSTDLNGSSLPRKPHCLARCHLLCRNDSSPCPTCTTPNWLTEGRSNRFQKLEESPACQWNTWLDKRKVFLSAIALRQCRNCYGALTKVVWVSSKGLVDTSNAPLLTPNFGYKPYTRSYWMPLAATGLSLPEQEVATHGTCQGTFREQRGTRWAWEEESTSNTSFEARVGRCSWVDTLSLCDFLQSVGATDSSNIVVPNDREVSLRIKKMARR